MVEWIRYETKENYSLPASLEDSIKISLYKEFYKLNKKSEFPLKPFSQEYWTECNRYIAEKFPKIVQEELEKRKPKKSKLKQILYKVFKKKNY